MPKFFLALAATLAFGFLPTDQSQAGLPKLPDASLHMDTELGTSIHYRSRFHRHARSIYEEEKRGKRDARNGRIPQAHIDACIRQNMGYQVYNNSIAVDRYTRRQCVTRHYQP